MNLGIGSPIASPGGICSNHHYYYFNTNVYGLKRPPPRPIRLIAAGPAVVLAGSAGFPVPARPPLHQ